MKYSYESSLETAGSATFLFGLPCPLLISHSLALHPVCTCSYNVTDSPGLKVVQNESE